MAIIAPTSVIKSEQFVLAPGEHIYAEVRNANGTKKTELVNDQCDPNGGKTLTSCISYMGQLS